MQVLSKKSGNNFYETFSDLLFCTLVLFIMLFLMLAAAMEKRVDAVTQSNDEPQNLTEQLSAEKARAEDLQSKLDELIAKVGDDPDVEKIKQALSQQAAEVGELKDELKQLVGSNRFTGRSGKTFISFATDHSRLTRRHWFVPQPLNERMTTGIHKESEASKSLRQKLCRMEFSTLMLNHSGFTDEQVSSIVFNGTTLYQIPGEEPIHMQLQSTTFSLVASGVLDLDGEATANVGLIYKVTDETFDGLDESNAAAVPSEEQTGTLPSLVFFPQEDQTLTIGGVNMGIEDAKLIILAVGGRGAAVEFRPSTPDWVLDKLLKPTGYINRVPTMTANEKSTLVP